MSLFHKRDRDAELAEELSSHVELRAAMNREEGLPPQRAETEARRQFGNVTRIYEETRQMRINGFLESAAQDLRYAFRGFLRNPSFTFSAILALGLGIGGATAVFSVVDRILFRSPPYREPARLVSIGMMAPLDNSEFMFSASYGDWQRTQTPFERMTAFGMVSDCDLTQGTPAALGCALVESNFLQTFGVEPILGRSFTPEEDVPNSEKVAIASYAFWQGRLGGDPNIVGKAISLNGAPTTIVGVLPASFELPRLNRFDLLVPLRLNRNLAPGLPGRDVRAFARLKPGVTIEQSRAAMAPLFQSFLPTVPPPFRKQVSLRIRSVFDLQTEQSRLASWLLLGAVGALLAIACANVANLMLARAARRGRELAVRAAIGASRARMIRQTLTESLALAFAGGVVGCILAFALLRAFNALAPAGIIRLDQARLDGRALLFSLAVMAGSGILFGIAPALYMPRASGLASARSVGTARGIFRQALVAGQIAISLVLLSGATLLMRSLYKLEAAPLGFDPDRAIAASFVLGPAKYTAAQRQQEFFEALEARLTAMPGVRAVSISDSIPPAGRTRSRPFTSLQAQGHPRYTQDTGGMITWRFVTPGYFDALAIPIVRGRAFTEQDRDPSRSATVLSQSLARRLFPGEEAVGRSVQFGDGEAWYEVIGIAADVKNAGATSPADPEYYLVRRHGNDPQYAQQVPPFGWRSGSVVIRAGLSGRAAADSLRAAIASLDPTLPANIFTMQERVAGQSVRPRFDAALLAMFAAMGLLLAAVGLYGVMAFLVAQRRQEIGLRMAIGASPGSIAGMVLGNAMRWTLAGAVLGIAGSWIAARAIETMLFEVGAHDPVSLAAAAGLLIAVALAAAWVPARRASMVDPLTALRVE